MNDSMFTVRRMKRAEDAFRSYCCMTETPTPWPQALCQCRDWLASNLGRHVDGYHVQLADGEVIGHLYYALSEQALLPYEVEPGVAVLYCEWVQQHYQHQGCGRLLFDTFVRDMAQAGAKGILVEGTDLEDHMHARHYLARGFQVIAESGHRRLLYFPLSAPRVDVGLLDPVIQPRRGVPVEIVILSGYACPYEVSTMALVREVAAEFGSQVTLQEASLTPETLRRFGAARGVFINGQQKLGGAETEDAVRQAILEEIERA
jgi:hypothetical protein